MKTEVKLDHIRHSLAHVLAAAVLKKFPDAKLGIGPTIDDGFYYDFLLPRTLTPEDLKEFEKSMKKMIGQKLPFVGKEITTAEGKKLFKNQPFKLELIKEFSQEKKPLTVYSTGDIFTDLCRGGHVENTKEINADGFKLDRLAGAYWKGDEKNQQLQRVYGLAFENGEALKKFIEMRTEAEKRDHKKLGLQLDLFVFSELVGSGLPLWTPKGTILRNLLDDFVWELRKKRGYVKVEIPHITKKELFQVSGHWDKFKKELFQIKTREGHEFAMKPMSCPHHAQIYARHQWSYRELPQRYANTTMCYRDEQTGELSGLSRARSFTQDDAHVFCRMEQAKEEFLKIWDIVHEFYSSFGLSLQVRLSLRDPEHPEKFLGDLSQWKKAEEMLREIAGEKKTDVSEGIGEAAFYGPKLDFMAKDSLGREWQVATIQLDMNQPERFDLACINEKGEHERIVMIHAAIMGSIERFLSIIIEHFAGAFPLWLSPVQVEIIPVGEKFEKYALGIKEKLLAENIRVSLKPADETLGKRIREAEMMKIPYVLVVGEKEEKNETVNVRHYKKGQIGELPVNDLVKKLSQEILEKKI
ncbi:MAG: threonine--tRNA ligase [Candidatus Ryanbacteria bacterium RIFCSPLOWO2_01_FULL_48_26]|uniref:Threonine--tRNA ligase n=1 Tax=Candidatus Ryanbacteria bacterium RIFCSPLOWO2_01_FULL_48_26 TaxID=1802126 RepID=A0A1G2GX32_9BACT|nr:MAG: threonine--tRNA ligase [Candidatus Ryanbacteria bacterium RIFCSPLOWO2_01_FULL_48_26]